MRKRIVIAPAANLTTRLCCKNNAATRILQYIVRLPDFILANLEPILLEWEAFARSLAPGQKMEPLALRDDAEAILIACARDMHTTQTNAEQASKSKGAGGSGGIQSDRLDDASSVHGVGRVGSGFNINEVVSEYRALRASVLRVWRASLPAAQIDDMDDITRFNEAIDQSLGKAVSSYTRRVDQSRRMLLAILSHDLRNPLNCIRMSARVASVGGRVDPQSSEALSLIETSVEAMSRLISDLLDFASTGIGAGIPLTMAPVNLDRLGREVIRELQATAPNRTLRYEVHGSPTCDCDSARVRQLLSNLVSNAIIHGSETGEVELSISAKDPEIVIAVRNQGTPIPASLMPTIFDPLVRDKSADVARSRRQGNIGLGLYIAHEIATAHGGTIDVQSSAETGTIFTVRLPRSNPPHPDTPSAG